MTARPFGRFMDAVMAKLGYKVAGPLDYLARYPGRVVAQSGDLMRLDVQLDLDVPGNPRRMASPSNISIRLGIPGVMVGIAPGCRVLVGWEQGDPTAPYIADWELGATVNEITIAGTTVYLGAKIGANFVALANLVDAELAKVQTAHNTHVHVLAIAAQAGAGGTGTAAPPVVTYTPAPTAATKAKAI